MKKAITSFVCQECGYESSSWLGKCPECNAWNSLKEIKIAPLKPGQNINQNVFVRPKNLSEITFEKTPRVKTGFSEVDGVLGGGLVKGSVILLAGDPGIGKSTLLLQVGMKVADSWGLVPGFPPASACLTSTASGPPGRLRAVGSLSTRATPSGNSNFSSSANGQTSTVLYVSGEESESQIKLRAERISPKFNNPNFLLASLSDTDQIISMIDEVKPSLVFVDSIQTVESQNLEGLAGSLGQVRYSALAFIRAAKSLGIPIILVGHVTKEGMVAGPMILSHMVDTVLFLEGEKTTGTRILRSFKNRFGPVDEVGIFVMQGEGMTQIDNAEKFFLSDNSKQIPGSAMVSTIEGTRAFLVEIQALVVCSKLSMPRRVAIGIDYKRLELLIAVLQKRCRLPLDTMDVFVNVAGGLKISDPACDAGICAALYSSLKNIKSGRTVFLGEVGLLGELRPVPLMEKRIKEAQKLGFKNIISPKTCANIAEVIKFIK